MMRFHVVSLPHTHSTAAYPSCAFTQKVVRFCAMMKSLGHHVTLYAGEQNEAPCDEHVVCVSEADRLQMVGDRHYTEADWGHPLWSKFSARVIEEMGRRVHQKDFICLIGGHAHKPIADAFPNHLSVEFGIGYAGTFAKYRVFESYAWMHMIYGAEAGRADAKDGHWFDAVIPNQFELPEPLSGPDGQHGPLDMGIRGPDFPGQTVEQFRERTDQIFNLHDLTCRQCAPARPYALYMGRLIDRKGYRIAQDLCEHAGVELVLAGPGKAGGYGTFVGEVGARTRYQLMAGARCLFVPTQYVEPFGTVHIEAMACGTPIISTDWGVFTETVQQGVHGFRCRTFGDFTEALAKVGSLDRKRIRDDAFARFSMPVVAQQYEAYFRRLSTLWGAGWYEGKEAAQAAA